MGADQEIARGWPAARGVRLTRNFGSQMAILAGLAEARGQAAAVLSADLQEPPELLPELVAAWRRGATAVLAVRHSRPEPGPTRAAAGLYYRTLRRLAFAQMPAGGFDCFLIGRPAIDFLVESREIHTSLPGLLLWGGFPTALVPYDRVAREEGESRWTLGKKLKYFIDSVISFSYAPLRWMSVGGRLLALVAFAYAVFLIAYKLLQRPADRGLDLADGRPRVLLGRPAPLARHPRRVPVADARRRPRAQGLPRAGDARSRSPRTERSDALGLTRPGRPPATRSTSASVSSANIGRARTSCAALLRLREIALPAAELREALLQVERHRVEDGARTPASARRAFTASRSATRITY